MDLTWYERNVLFRLAKDRLDDIDLLIANGGDDDSAALNCKAVTLRSIMAKLKPGSMDDR